MCSAVWPRTADFRCVWWRRKQCHVTHGFEKSTCLHLTYHRFTFLLQSLNYITLVWHTTLDHSRYSRIVWSVIANTPMNQLTLYETQQIYTSYRWHCEIECYVTSRNEKGEEISVVISRWKSRLLSTYKCTHRHGDEQAKITSKDRSNLPNSHAIIWIL